MATTPLLKKNMRLFGLPYQFNKTVDPRVESFSTSVGRKFAENIIMDAPVISIIPGNPKYLAGSKDKRTITQSLLETSSDNFNPIKSIIKGKSNNGEVFKYYDFERAYTEYMKYVNILCRTCASFLELKETIDGCSCQRYDYRKYRWTTDKIHTNTGHSQLSEINLFGNSVSDDNDTSTVMKYTTTEDEDDGVLEQLAKNYNFVQFFIDSDIRFDETSTNEVGESMIKSALDQGQNLFKELSFITGSAGIEGAGAFMQDSVDALSQGLADTLGGTNSNLLGAIGRVLDLSGNVVKGENIIMPQIYQRSTYSKSYSFTVHLKTPYGTKFGYFMDICVPLMHLIALGLPKQTTANTYGAPFLVKAYCEGIFTCNMGIVQSISVSKGINSAFSADGLPTEVDVTVSIEDLYSDLSMSPQSSPLLFANNSSLVEYLATTCGLSLVSPNISKRLDSLVNNLSNAISDIPNTIISSITEAADNLIMNWAGLTW